MRSVWQNFAVQLRVVGALIIREIYTRYGRESLGFAWIIAEPLVFAIPVLVVWSVVRNSVEHGVALMPLLWSGYLPLLLFRHVGGRMLFIIRANAGLLYHARVTIFDIFLARFLLELGSNVAAAAVSFMFFYMLGELDAPRDLPMLYLGYFFMAWWSGAIGLVVAAGCERSDWIEKIWQPYSYLFMFFSGFFFLSAWLPPRLRELALLQPYFNAYEMIRQGMFGNTVQFHYSIGYTVFTLAIVTLIGLVLLRDGRKHVVLE
jgi:capsular polysaccharide transport system permease protein